MITPEERFTRIENAIQALTETQVRQEGVIEKQNAGIRDLIALSRIFLDSQKESTSQIHQITSQIEELRHTLKQTDERLNGLIATVDRFIQGLQGGNGSR